jgi:8-oxo-dGTP diphosphatase
MIAVTIVERGGALLLLRRSPTAPWKPGWWNLPGGEVEDGEMPLRAAERELFEEAGLSNTTLTQTATLPTEWGPLHVFKTTAPPEYVPTLCYESDAYRWVSAGVILADLVPPLEKC